MKDMRRIDRKMEKSEALALLLHSTYGILATVDCNDQPYGIPLNYVVVVHDFIYFHCAPEGHKLQSIGDNRKSCFTVVGRMNVLPGKFSTDYESVVVFGQASLVKQAEEKIMALQEFVKKYSADFIPQGDTYIEKAKDKVLVFKMSIEHCTGKRRGFSI
jgi:nitroimidazol reductase NimA-like FMN-containing flavoprotein (pyridoxamine 5'-phosphate oxidase superfamily)